jgi:hypothetical protein
MKRLADAGTLREVSETARRDPFFAPAILDAIYDETL